MRFRDKGFRGVGGETGIWRRRKGSSAVFFPMVFLGAGGMMRRVANPLQYEFLKPLQPLNVFITVSAILLNTDPELLEGLAVEVVQPTAFAFSQVFIFPDISRRG